MSNAPRLAAVIGILSLLLAACGGTGPQAPTLDGRTFVSTAVNGHALVPGSQVQLTFRDGRDLGASAGCNTIGGTYTLTDGVLRLQAAQMTEMGCDPERHAQDEWLVEFLSAGPALTLTGNELTLARDGTTIRLVDREVAQPDLPLAGPVWTLESLIVGDAVGSIPGGVVATLTFGPDGRVDVNAGCNRGGGTAIVDGDQIAFGPIATTKMACQGPAGDIEAAMLDVLRAGRLTFAIDASRLTLLAPNGRGLGFVGG
jgi:heat shock protein HslJ